MSHTTRSCAGLASPGARRSARARSRTVLAAAGAGLGAVVLSACGSLYDVNLPGGADVGKNPITVRVEFRDVLDLVPQSTVKVDDVTVGRVTAIKLKGYTADVTLKLPRGIDLPDNAVAEIRQTSLLGEKFVSLSAPAVNPSSDKLGNGDTIPLSRTGRNPEVEEVLGALSLLLNGGGVGQLKIIASELNTAFGGRESQVRSVITQLHEFLGQLDANKVQIVRSIEALNRLAVQLKAQDGAITSALDDLPAAIKSVDSQRADLVKTLKALDDLSGIGVRVIKASKTGTIDSLRSLSPILEKLAESGANVAKSLQVSLTYPFVDAAVGNDPQVARNLHIGDFVNLDARLDIDLTNLPVLPSVSIPGCAQVVADAKKTINKTVNDYVGALPLLTAKQKDKIKKKVIPQLYDTISCDDPLNGLKNLPNLVLAALDLLDLPTPSLPIPTLPTLGIGGLRAGTSYADAARLRGNGKVGDMLNGPAGTADQLGYNSTLGALLEQGVVSR